MSGGTAATLGAPHLHIAKECSPAIDTRAPKVYIPGEGDVTQVRGLLCFFVSGDRI